MRWAAACFTVAAACGRVGYDPELPAGSANACVAAVEGGLLHACALKRDGTVWCWGSNESGQLGDESPPAGRPLPGRVPGLADVEALSAGEFETCALGRGGALWCWGRGTQLPTRMA